MAALSPAVQNVICSVAVFLWVKSIMTTIAVMTERGAINARVGRKIVHICAGSYCIFWPLFRPEHWTWRLNILVFVLYGVSLFVKGAIIRDPNDPEVIALCRSGDPLELLYGPIHFCLAAGYFGIRGFNEELGVLVLSCLGFGDGVAPIAGMAYPMGRYPTFPFGESAGRKTLTGSAAFFFGSIAGYCILRTIVLGGVEDLSKIVTVAATSAVAEGFSGDYDNLSISLVAYVTSLYVMP